MKFLALFLILTSATSDFSRFFRDYAWLENDTDETGIQKTSDELGIGFKAGELLYGDGEHDVRNLMQGKRNEKEMKKNFCFCL